MFFPEYIIFAMAGIVLIYHTIDLRKKEKEHCIVRVLAQVIQIDVKRPSCGSSLLYKPIFKTSMDGEEIIIDSENYTNIFKFQVGQLLWLNINPDNPQEFTYESPYKDIILLCQVIQCMMPFLAILLCYYICIRNG